MNAADLYRRAARQKGKAAGNWDEDLVVVMDDEDRAWGPRRYAARRG